MIFLNSMHLERKESKMKKKFKCLIATFLVISLTFINATSVGAIDVVGENVYSYTPENYLEYDYINQTYCTIPIDSVFDYASTTTTTYELAGMTSELPRLEAMNQMYDSSVLPVSVVDPSKYFMNTAPQTIDGPQPPFSGVVLILTGYDKNGDGIKEWSRGTGFMVAPDVMVTAAHNVVKYDANDQFLNTEVRVYPFYDAGSLHPLNTNVDYIYPARWRCYEYEPALKKNDYDTGDLDVLDYDWCVMKLQESIENAYNFACSTAITTISNSRIAVSGYPKCVLMSCGNTTDCKHQETFGQYSTYGTATAITPYRIEFNNNTKGGMSGGPVYDVYTTICYAINSYEYNDCSGNGATIITPNIYNAIADYINL